MIIEWWMVGGDLLNSDDGVSHVVYYFGWLVGYWLLVILVCTIYIQALTLMNLHMERIVKMCLLSLHCHGLWLFGNCISFVMYHVRPISCMVWCRVGIGYVVHTYVTL